MKILVIHQYYLRDDEGGGGRFNELVRWWRRAGHEVEVIAGQVHYASGERGGRGWVEREASGVWRVWTPGVWRAGFVGRGVAMGGWAAAASVVALRLGRWADVVVASSPSLLAALPGMTASLVGKPWVFEVRDLWPESAVAMGVLSPDGLATRALYGLEAAACGGAARVVAVTPAIGADLVRRGLVAGERVAVIPNGAELELLSPGEPEAALMERLGWAGRFVALYLGAHGLANGLDQLIDAAEALGERDDVLIAAMGDGPERARLIAETARRGLTRRLHWLPSVPRGEVARYLRGAGCGLAVLRGAATFRTVYPNKLFDAMACGKPVVCNIEGAAAALVREASGGLCVAPEAPEALAGAICWLADHRDEAARMGQDGLRHVSEHFAREQLARSYLELLDQVIAEARQR